MRGRARSCGDAVASDAPEDGSYPENDEHDIMDKQVVIVDLEGSGCPRSVSVRVQGDQLGGVVQLPRAEQSHLRAQLAQRVRLPLVRRQAAAHRAHAVQDPDIPERAAEQYKALQQLFEDADIDYLTPQVEGEQTKEPTSGA